jgi:hypothetical protein
MGRSSAPRDRLPNHPFLEVEWLEARRVPSAAPYPLDGAAASVPIGPREDGVSIAAFLKAEARSLEGQGNGNADGLLNLFEADVALLKEDLELLARNLAANGGGSPTAAASDQAGANGGGPATKLRDAETAGGRLLDSTPGLATAISSARASLREVGRAMAENIAEATVAEREVRREARQEKVAEVAGDVAASDDPSAAAPAKGAAADLSAGEAPSGPGLAAEGKPTGTGPANIVRGLTPGIDSDNRLPATSPDGDGEGAEVPAGKEEVAGEHPGEYDLAAPAGAPAADGALVDYAPGPSAALDQALEQFVAQVEAMSREAGRAVQDVGAAPWVATILLAGAAVEWSRSHRSRRRFGLAGVGGDMTWMWVTGLPGTFSGRRR